MNLYFLLSSLLLVSLSSGTPRNRAERPPVILIPGDGGNRLDAKVNLKQTVSIFCTKRSDNYFLLWANVKYFFPYIINCFVNMMRLVRNPVTGLTSNSPGVDIRVPGWGKTFAVEWLSNLHISKLSYYKTIIDSLVKNHGYTRDIDIRGAPYDFRKAPNELHQYFANLRQLIEETYSTNGNRSVLLISHSYGGPLTLQFLQLQSQAWKDKFISSFISISGAFAGSLTSVKVMASGDNFGIPTVSPLTVRKHQRTLPSTVYLLPKKPAWSSNSVVAMTDRRNYTVGEYDAFYRDMGIPQAIPLTNSVINLTNLTLAPGVKIHCVLTRHTPTPAIFNWRGLNFPDAVPNAINGEGDGTVNWRSLKVCPDFAKLQSQPVTTTMIENTDHSAILQDPRLTEFVNSIV